MGLKLVGTSLKKLLSSLRSRKANRELSSCEPFSGSDLEAMKRISDKVFANVRPGMKIDLGTRLDA
jgi:hypothetical protein